MPFWMVVHGTAMMTPRSSRCDTLEEALEEQDDYGDAVVVACEEEADRGLQCIQIVE
jgi:hypothetical protein